MQPCRKRPRRELRHRILHIEVDSKPETTLRRSDIRGLARYNLTKEIAHRNYKPCSCAKERLSRIIEVTCSAARE